MNKRQDLIGTFILSFALLGILVLQFYWISITIQSKEEVFSHSVLHSLNRVGQAIEQREMREYVLRFMNLMDDSDLLSKMREPQIKEFIFVNENKNSDDSFIYIRDMLQNDYVLSSAVLERTPLNDSMKISNHKTIHSHLILDTRKQEPTISYEQLGNISAIDKAIYEEMLRKIASRQPIADRVSKWNVDLLIQQELANQGMKMDFEFAILRNNKLTSVRTKNFSKDNLKCYRVPIFRLEDSNIEYELAVVFPHRHKYLLESIIGVAIMSFALILLMIIIFIKGVLQFRKQKQISEIKTDFINNMTHEFKTPIATINLALDAMKNPMIYKSDERLQFYLNMIREENKRMHAQVENVLRISRLEKNQFNIEKERLDAHDLIESALDHVQLLLEEKNGEVKKHLKATCTDILANDLHFVNILVNILENAIKYSSESPKIDVYTENIKDNILIKIQDRGIGMSKAALKRVFNKFYREHTGDIHNVKGHGLGLAYVKRIVEDHHGQVYAESEKGKGSTFYIKIPVIY